LRNQTFRHALYSLAHPISIAAILILLFNDHWLRLYYPSWLTGKLGDFSWLVFAPFICAVPLAWILPRSVVQNTRQTVLISICIIGIWFTLAKTVPVIHQLTTILWEALIGWKGTQRLDPTDLFTLPALVLSWYVWRTVQPVSSKYYRWLLLMLGVVATLASDQPFYSFKDAGITTICAQQDQLVVYFIAQGEYTIDNSRAAAEYKLSVLTAMYTSQDGGLTWEFSRNIETTDTPKFNSQAGCSGKSNVIVDPSNSQIQYRWQPGERIESSIDGGQTWAIDYDLYQLRQDVRKHYNPSLNDFSTSYDTSPGPRSGLVDAKTGNVLLAMGWEGIFTRTPDGNWHWIKINDYKLEDLSDPDQVLNVIGFEEWLAIALIILFLVTAHGYIWQSHPIWQVIVAVGWGGWLMLTLIFIPAYHASGNLLDTEWFLPTVFLPPILLLLAFPLTVIALWSFLRNFRRILLKTLLVAFITAGVFIFPYILWAHGTIPRYGTARIFALLLTASGLLTSFSYLRHHLPGIRTMQVSNIKTESPE
jgi:hypothetical protein